MFLSTIVGGELKDYTELMEEARNEAVQRIGAQAQGKGANAIIGIRFAMSGVAPGAAHARFQRVAASQDPAASTRELLGVSCAGKPGRGGNFMSRKMADCRMFPSKVGCTLTLAGEEDEVLRAATEHAISVHGHSNSPELRDQIRRTLKDEGPSGVSASESRSFKQPDEVRKFKAHGHLKVINFKDGKTIGKAVFEPGWVWSNDVKPIAGTASCQAAHAGYCLRGEMEIRMDDGRSFRIRSGDAFEIEPGHDAHVVGGQSCELIDVGGFAEYAKPASARKAA